jgi:hypothetical protein
MAAGMMGVSQVKAQNQDFMPGEVIVGLKEPHLGSAPEELFSELEIEEIEDLYGRLYESFKNIPYLNENALERIRGLIGTSFIITLVDKSDEAVLSAIEILEQNPNVRHAHPNYISRLDPDPLSLSNIHTAGREFFDGIIEAYNKGIISDKELYSSFSNVITRAEFCRMAVRWVEYATGKSIDEILSERGLARNPDAFTDTDDPYILAAFALGITSGVGGNRFGPNGQFTREQAATMIMNACRVIGADVSNPPPSGFVDMDSVSDWAVNGVNFVRANGIMQDTVGNAFNPRGMYTIQESIVTFNNIKHNTLAGR